MTILRVHNKMVLPTTPGRCQLNLSTKPSFRLSKRSPEERVNEAKVLSVQAQLRISSTEVKMKTTTPPPFLLLLNGFPGVGKLSIARNLQDLLTQAISGPVSGPQVRLLDNHLLIDPVAAIDPERRNTSHLALRKAFRDMAFSALASQPGELIILMTSCLAETERGRSEFEEYASIARDRGCVMVVLNLVCGVEENRSRLGSEERRGRAGSMEKGKLVDGDVLERIREEYSLLDLGTVMEERRRTETGQMICGDVETTELRVEQTTEKVWAFLREKLEF